MPPTFGIPPTQPYVPKPDAEARGPPEVREVGPLAGMPGRAPPGRAPADSSPVLAAPVTPDFGGDEWRRYMEEQRKARQKLDEARRFLQTCYAPDPVLNGIPAADRDPMGCLQHLSHMLDRYDPMSESD